MFNDETTNRMHTMDDGAFMISFQYRFEAAHRLTKATTGTCMTPHGHSWYAKAIFGSSANLLNTDDMVMEFALLKKGWKAFIHETADHSYFHHYQDALLPALRDCVTNFRGLPFPSDPTTEMVAALFYAKICSMHKELCDSVSGTLQGSILPVPTGILIQETPTNSIELSSGPALNALLNKLNERYVGWWQVSDPMARFLDARG